MDVMDKEKLEIAQLRGRIKKLEAVAEAAIPVYKRLVILQKMGPLGESPMWTKKLGDALEELGVASQESDKNLD